jgi:Cof subfamily protein (haloacid dehalogenase superfamily)
MNIKLIAFDLDGTALNSRKELSPRTVEALSRASAAGIRLLPCTGRQIFNVPKPLLAMPFFDFLVTDNGATVFSLPGREVLYSTGFDAGTAREIISRSRRLKALVFGSLGIDGALDTAGRAWREEATLRMIERNRQTWRSPERDLEKESGAFCKFSLIFPDEESRREGLELFETYEKAEITFSDRDNLEIMPLRVNKAGGLRRVADRLGIAMEQVMAIGDNHNDLEMIKAAGRGVAMGNAVDEIRKAAVSVTLSNDEDGAALAVEAVLKSQGAL